MLGVRVCTEGGGRVPKKMVIDEVMLSLNFCSLQVRFAHVHLMTIPDIFDVSHSNGSATKAGATHPCRGDG